jgi:signal transduction histidine kinase
LARLEQPPERYNSGAMRASSSLRNVFEDAVSQCKPLAELKAIAVNLDFSADARVPIDSRDAFLLCSNILLNALQHSPNGAAIQMALTVDDDMAHLTLQDQGEGISEKDLGHIFEPFYRGDPSRSRKSGGTGLGLSICKAICEAAGGSIEIANGIAGGVLVTVKLPAELVVSQATPSAWFKA